MRAIFGPPVTRPLPDGLMFTIDLVPVHEGRIVAFRWPGLSQLAGAPDHPWLPWDHLEYGEQPSRAVVRILSQWTGRTDLAVDARMADLYSMVGPDGVWHVSLIFRVELVEPPEVFGHIEEVLVIGREELPEHLGWFPKQRLLAYLDA